MFGELATVNLNTGADKPQAVKRDRVCLADTTVHSLVRDHERMPIRRARSPSENLCGVLGRSFFPWKYRAGIHDPDNDRDRWDCRRCDDCRRRREIEVFFGFAEMWLKL